MKKNYTLFVALCGGLCSLAFLRDPQQGFERGNFHKRLNIDGAPAGRTGAPGESNCTECHGGALQSGANLDTIFVTQNGTIVNSFVPGQTYDVRVSMGDFAARNGFELTALTSTSHTASGTLAAVTANGNKKITGAGKQYITHTLSGNASHSWQFTWTAPASGAEGVTFYVATNKTNSSSTDIGDLIRTSNFSLNNSLGLAENSAKMDGKAWYNAAKNSVAVSLSDATPGKVNISVVNQNGQVILSEGAGSTYAGDNLFEVTLPSGISPGIYLVTVAVDNALMTKKVVVSH